MRRPFFATLSNVLRKILPEIAWNPDFQKIWWAQILSQLAVNTLLYTLVIRIAERTASNTAISVFILSFTIPAVIFGLLAGIWVDRLDKRLVLMATNIIRTALIPFFLFAEQGAFYLIYPLAILTSIVTQFFIPAEGAKIASIVPHKELHQANSLFTFTLYAAIIAGPIAAGPGLRILGLDNLIILLFGLFAVSTFLTYLLPKDKGGGFGEAINGTGKGRMHNELGDALRHVWGSNRLMGALLILTFSQTIISMISALAPGYARSVLGADVTDTSVLLLAPAALGMIAGALAMSRVSHAASKRALVTAGIFLAGLQLVLLGSVRAFDDFGDIAKLAAALLFILGATNALIAVPSQTAIQIHTPEELRGRVFGVLNTLMNGASFLPVLFAGVIADIFGVQVMIILTGIIVFFTGFYIQDKARQLK